MAEETKELEMPKHLDEIKGTTREQLAAKTKLISKFGFDKWNELVGASARGTKR